MSERMISYSQNLEDVLINRIFDGKPTGFYIDVGAADPVHNSVTKHFYTLGWRGINIDPLPHYHEALMRDRERDINLNIGLSDHDGSATFWEVVGTELSSFNEEIAKTSAQLWDKPLQKRAVPITTLTQICQEYQISHCDFLKIDAENHELPIIRGIDFSKLKATLIVIESIDPITQKENHHVWHPLLEQAGYIFAHFDGLNRYYISSAQQNILPVFSKPISILDYVKWSEIELLKQLTEKEHEIKKLTNICQEREDLLKKHIEEEIDENATKNTLKKIANERLKTIHALQLALNLIHQRHWKNRIRQWLKGIMLRFYPKIGNLNQYAPRKLSLPKKYRKLKNLKKYPKISIVTPSYNQGTYIEKTICSVLDQKYPNLEYIVQDGKSIDVTIRVLKKYNQSILWESCTDQGQTNAINIGFQKTKGDIMAYLNSDDLLLPGSLNYIAHYFAKNPKVDVVYGHRILINEEDHEIGRWVLPKHCNKVLEWVDYIPQETLFWRRSAWEKIGSKLDENFKFAMDWDLILRFKEAGLKFARLPRFLGAFRIHQQQKTLCQISDTGMQEMKRLRLRCHGREVNHGEIRKNIKTYLIKHLICHKLFRLGFLKY